MADHADAAPTAFGLGPVPGTDLVAAADVVLSESPLPHIPHLPERGAGSDVIGRTAALLPLNVDIGPRSWQIHARPQIATMRARDQWKRDLDLLEELWAGKVPELKIQLVGPWSLAAEIEMPNGHRMITDHGALRDITDALVEAVGEHRRDVEKRMGATTVLQLDEPKLDAVVRGALQGTTDYEDIPPVSEDDVLERLGVFGPHLLNASRPMYGADWFTVGRAVDADGLGEALDRGARTAFPVMEPNDVFALFDRMQLDPVQHGFDVYAEPAPTLLATAHNYRAAVEMVEALAPRSS
ncbi:methionine synthase [Corynebacterium sp. CCUG 69979]|uniref:methionine synthase n=1 Tax=Corynebacterium sp. CCUG 69979 TaxID=2823890 RepID=UPI00210D46E2|nr:methionine synthase [Corynebacterium sp. CCUG 69979]MCQ4625023.1 methionine synthase [Corynebacterium sp. CCUG 69979]